ncbi:MAG: hypothetical protein PW786_12680 [Arachidicoccus sp.]|nr:hypothetical protein [Arachidicoccus sp.]
MLFSRNRSDIRFYKAIKNLIFYISIFSIALIACKKDTNNDLDLLSSSSSGIIASYVENASQYSVDSIEYNLTPDYIGIPIQLDKGAEDGDTVFAKVDPSLVESYNKLYQETNHSIPDSAFGASHGGVFPIGKGATQSKDSLYAILKDASNLVDSFVYLVPIRLSEKKSSGLKTSIVFFKMKVRKYGALSAMVNPSNLIAYKGGYLMSEFFSSNADGTVPELTSIKIGVMLNQPFTGGHDLKVSAVVHNDDSTIQAFGNYLSFPNAFTVVKSEVVIPAGSLYSKDSIEIEVNSDAKFVKYKSTLMIVELMESQDKDYAIPLIETKKKVYVSVFTY